MSITNSITETSYWDSLIGRSTMRFFLLACLARRPMHGYELSKEISGCCGGCCTPTDAMIYPAIKDLREAGLITCESTQDGGRTRNVCSLTQEGREAYKTAAASWNRFLPYINDAVDGGLRQEECT